MNDTEDWNNFISKQNHIRIMDYNMTQTQGEQGIETFGFPHRPSGYVSLDEINTICKTVVENKEVPKLEGKDSVEGGRKFDYGKTMYRLLPPHFLQEYADILTLGAKKYDVENWKLVPDAKERYKDAALRHLYNYLQGNTHDNETGKHELAHVACNLGFLYELERLNLNP